ncbi:lysophospholipid acyltransferase family protein [Agitococcus lubricus]|uniref:Diacylglycerol acyltransferase n=1 Tax=Agitococcus lubricus TaxID=1077255 RepID=A0A2T5J093_9GAMM|nr:lysophospholipid acyltransferase family protein [Agitococcus lubricus]PTQ89759.1 diacylglycerol acyltransferase [Agitococcus lubricus]
MSNFHPLTFIPPQLKYLQAQLWLQKAWFDPVFVGLDNLDSTKPALYVGNHTLYGTLDGPLMVLGLLQHKGIFLRSLGDYIHFRIPLWRDVLWQNGCVAGTPENCRLLMEAKEHILVYPGGGREVMKNKGEQYQLVWKERTGFARMAMEQGYDIIPFAAVGADDAFDIHYDAQDFQQSALGRWLTKTGLSAKYFRHGDNFMPITTGVGLLPRPEKFYFAFGERINTQHWQVQADNKAAQWQVRTQVEDAIYGMMADLFKRREQDYATWPLWRRKLTKR